MPCRNAGPFLQAAVQSVLSQPECLELLAADGGSTDGSLEALETMASADPRLRIISRSDAGPAEALNKAFRAARGTLIGWLNADDLSPPGAFARAVNALAENPEWLMVYGEGEEFNEESGLVQRYPTLPPSVSLSGFQSHCFICQPAVVFRRSMGVLLGSFNEKCRTAFDFDYWLRAFAAFPHRIGYIPHLQGRTRLHSGTITSKQRAQVALEATKLLARQFGSADATRLHNYALELQLGLAELPEQDNLQAHLHDLFAQAQPSLSPNAATQLQSTWLTGDPPPHPQSEHCSWQPNGHQPSTKTITPFQERPYGVNLIGHAFEMFGIGEDIRMAAQALQVAGVPCCVIHHPAANGAACSDRTLEPLICTDPAGGPYAFNWVCMAAPIQARWLRQVGSDPLRERYTIASWPWETQQWPNAWLPLLDVADELWPSSHFTAAALAGPAAEAGRPMQVMPMAAEITDPDRFCNAAARIATRQRHGLPTEAVLFSYGFDLNSTAIRKNPMGALEVFQRAFPLPHLPATFGRDCPSHPLAEQVSLMIKTFPPRRFSAEWEWLQARAAEDSRIVLIAESLPRDELLSLYGCCDVFLSLHRSEGFGRGMAEALQLGVDVITTDFGGNTDFCKGPLAHPVRWRKAPIPRGSYPNADGHSWAEPDLGHAADLCQRVAERRHAIATNPEAADPSRDAMVLADYRKRFSFEAAGARYLKRLEELWAQRGTTAARLLWRKN
ncbi:glycosyltransferase [Synechococcus sp. W2B2]|uniref:glycosyltransferase n=1 Tax=unclassified Synechococcus TaxID=2626047 RepID=UPI00006B3DD3|nr:glycosyltransferase [Synechococcus sp. WH 7805]EAR19352.1 glycosyltransferase [Synechococcus sp. WH 7805]